MKEIQVGDTVYFRIDETNRSQYNTATRQNDYMQLGIHSGIVRNVNARYNYYVTESENWVEVDTIIQRLISVSDTESRWNSTDQNIIWYVRRDALVTVKTAILARFRE